MDKHELHAIKLIKRNFNIHTHYTLSSIRKKNYNVREVIGIFFSNLVYIYSNYYFIFLIFLPFVLKNKNTERMKKKKWIPVDLFN